MKSFLIHFELGTLFKQVLSLGRVGEEETGHRNFGDGLCGCWWNCLVFQADLCSGNAMGSRRVDPA